MRGIKNLACYLQLIIALFSSPVLLNAQKSSVKADKETLNLILNADDKKGKETGALILLKDYQMTVNATGQTKLVLRVLGKIYSTEAMADYSQIPIGYNSFYLEPILNYARIIHSDGTIREVSKDAVQIKTMPESQGLQYTDNRFLSFALSGMEPGASFDYQVTLVQKNPEIEGQWFENHWFAGMLQNLTTHIPRIDPVVLSRFTLFVPKGTMFQYYISKVQLTPSKESLRDQDKYVWILKDLPSIKFEEAMPNLSKLNPVLLISSLKDWSQFDEWAAKKLFAKAEITDEISSKVKELTTELKNDDDKIRVISDYIQSNIHYIYADLERGGFTPHSVSEILRSRYGDCKDQTILFISMLKAAGIEAYPALLNPYPGDDFTYVPAPWFSHVITFIPNNGREIWLDLTSGVTPFPGLCLTDQGRKAFIVNGKSGRLVQTPATGPEDNISRFDLKGSFKGDTAFVTINVESKGMYGDVLKSLFKQLDTRSKEIALKEIITTHVEKAVFYKTEISDVNNPELPLKISIKFFLPGLWTKNEEALNWGSYALLPLSFLASINVKSFPEERQNDIVNILPFSVKGSESFTPPVKGYLPISMPQADSLMNDYFEYTRSFSKKGDTPVMNWSFTNKAKVITADHYKNYVDAIKTLNQKLLWEVSYVDPLSYCQKMLQIENTYKILSFCSQLLLDDKENVFALLLRGMVYGKLKQDDQQVKAFEEALKLAPENKYVQLFLTYPETAQKNSNFVLARLNRALEIDPYFEEALITRAQFYSNQKDYVRALDDIDKILGFNPRSVMGLTGKGSILFKMGKKLDAYAAFEKTLEIDSSNIMLCTMLGQSYLLIDSSRKAINLYTRAIRMDPANAGYLGNLGWAWYLENNDQKCIEYSQKALIIEPKTYFAKYNLALANLRSGKIHEARKLYAELKSVGDIPKEQRDGGKKDLDDLKAKRKYVNEINAILIEYF
jgi:tetratricopeptide (TPR) repeat protein